MTTYRPERSADEHARHDQPLVVAYVSGDLSADEARSARQLTESCRCCAALADEILDLQKSIANDLGAPSRPRDFRLSEDDAARLTAGPLSRLLRRLGGPGMTMLQPLAGAAMAIGLVLVVATGGFAGFGAGAASAPYFAASDTRTNAPAQDGIGTTRQSPAPAPAAGATTGPAAGATTGPEPSNELGSVTARGPVETPEPPTKSALASPEPGVDPRLLAGTVLLVAGGALLVLRLVARRFARDPLLR
jgi:hypothetical protein